MLHPKFKLLNFIGITAATLLLSLSQICLKTRLLPRQKPTIFSRIYYGTTEIRFFSVAVKLCWFIQLH